MKTVFSSTQLQYVGRQEFTAGGFVPCFESPERAEFVLQAVKSAGLGEIIEPDYFGVGSLLRVHDADYLTFLETVWGEWEKLFGDVDAFPYCIATRTLNGPPPDIIQGKMGYYSFALDTPITSGMWDAARASANSALTGASLLFKGEHSAFALCRPPGHHAAADLYGGYCFLNNAAVATQWLRDNGTARVAILDIDYHHGNGTQSIFYDRDDVFFASIHADPMQVFPFFLGHADETGDGDGAGYNRNYPLAKGTGFDKWREALQDALHVIQEFGADVLVVSLGVDTYENDPISHFKLTSDDFLTVGKDLADPGIPTLFLMEGGYATEAIGRNVANVLTGFGT